MLQEDHKKPTVSYVSADACHRLTAYATAHRLTVSYATTDTCHRLTAYATGPYFFYRGSKTLHTRPVSIGRSLLLHKCVSGFVFRETVKQLLKSLRSVYVKTLLIHIDKIVINICHSSVDILTPLG